MSRWLMGEVEGWWGDLASQGGRGCSKASGARTVAIVGASLPRVTDLGAMTSVRWFFNLCVTAGEARWPSRCPPGSRGTGSHRVTASWSPSPY